MSVGTLIRTMSGEFLNALSPVRLFNMEQARKLGGALEHTGLPGMGRSSVDRAGAFMRGRSMGDIASAWWGGHYFDKIPDLMTHPRFGAVKPEAFAQLRPQAQRLGNLYSRVAERNAMVRRSTVGVLGAATVGTMVLGRDHIVSDVGNMGISGAATVGPAAAMLEYGAKTGSGLMKTMGLAWAGLGTFNAMRGGDNWGPF